MPSDPNAPAKRARRSPVPRRALGAGVIAAASLLGGVATATTPAVAAPKKVALMNLSVGEGTTTVPAIPSSVIDVASKMGFYRKYGLNVTIDRFNATPQVVDALQSGAVDVGYIDTTSALELNAQHSLSIRGFDSPEVNNDFLIAASDSISSVGQLNGATFGISAPGGSDEVDSEAALGTLGVNFNSLKLVNIGAPATRALSLVAGKVQATTMSVSTWETIAGQPGVHVLVSPAKYAKAAPIVSKLDFATTKTLQTKKKAILAFTEALMATSRYSQKHPKTWAMDDSPLSNVPVNEVEAVTPYFTKDWCENGCIVPADLQKTETFIYSTTPVLQGTIPISLSTWIDTSVTAQALQALGRAAGYQ